MSRIRTSILAQLAVAEAALIATLTIAALLIVSSSAQYADPERTQWPAFVVQLAPNPISWAAVFIVGGAAAAYLVLRIANTGRFPFWAITALLMAAHIPDLWAHNRIDWHGFFGRYIYFSEPLPVLASAAIFLFTVAGLVALHRIIQLGAQAREMESRGVNSEERDAVIRNEAVSIAVIIVVSLALASVTVLIGAAVGRADTVSGLGPWTVVTVGIAATLLLAGFLLFLYRGLSGGPESSITDIEDDPFLTEEPGAEPS